MKACEPQGLGYVTAPNDVVLKKEHSLFKCKYNQCVVTGQGCGNSDSVSVDHIKH